MEDGISSTLILLAIIGAVLTVVASIFLIRWARDRWSVLKSELFPDSNRTSNDGGANSGFRSWPRQLPAILASAQENALTALHSDSGVTIHALQQDPASWIRYGTLAQTEAIRALDTNEVCSSLLDLSGHYLYIVAVPNRHEHPSLLQKHSCFASGWDMHFRQLRNRLASKPDFQSLTGFTIFLDPDGKDGVLFCSLADKETIAVPPTLISTEQRTHLGAGNRSIMLLPSGKGDYEPAYNH